MGVKNSLEKGLVKFGKNNNPTLVAMSIACAKGVFRPAFTMMDTKESYETKKYTACREGLTELIAIPVYYSSGVISEYISKKISVPKNFMSKKIYQRYQSGDRTPEVLKVVSNAETLAKTNLPKIKTTSAFIGVGLSALLLIPMICSATIKPIMNIIEKSGSKPASNAGITITKKPIKKPNSFNGVYRNNMFGMKVGGL